VVVSILPNVCFAFLERKVIVERWFFVAPVSCTMNVFRKKMNVPRKTMNVARRAFECGKHRCLPLSLLVELLELT
jgi:hypothetical protein